jgi:undecaprenyl-phosphate 4-deoxy-4-formamido-L-arabinose transferase
MNLSVVIPVYNSAESLTPLVERLQPALEDASEQFELILVNDGSRDRSWERITELSHAHSWIRGIGLMRNFGQHNALLCGIRNARYETILTIDDDLQHPPEEISKLLEQLDDQCDVVYGYPQSEKHGFLRNIASILTKIALKGAMGVDVARRVSAFRVFRTYLRDAFQTYNGNFVSIDVLLTWGTTRFRAVPVRHNSRTIGQSNYTVRKLINHAFNMITGFSALPLQVASLLGFIMTVFGFLVFVYVIGRYLLQGAAVQGFVFLASIISIFSGAQMFSLGIIGEYLARMHFRLMDRPAYLVKTVSEDPTTENKP